MRSLKRLWAIAHSLYGDRKKEVIYSRVEFLYNKERLRDLTDEEFGEMIKMLLDELSEKECPSAPNEWRLIKSLQRQLGWDEEHLMNYIKKHANVDHPRFLNYYTARAIVTGLKRIKKYEQKKEN